MSSIKVSVILPVYNVESYLRQCLEKIEKLPKTVRIRINQVRWHGKKSVLTPLSEVYLNTVSGIVSGKYRFKESDLFDPLLHVENHEDLLDKLADLLDHRFMNSRDIYEQFARNDFYDFNSMRSWNINFTTHNCLNWINFGNYIYIIVFSFKYF